eukprot:597016-Rhodomonas_salina.1
MIGSSCPTCTEKALTWYQHSTASVPLSSTVPVRHRSVIAMQIRVGTARETVILHIRVGA